MEIRTLHLRIEEKEINHWIHRAAAGNEEMRGISVEVVPHRVVIQGEYYIMRMWLPFTGQVAVGADQGKVVLRLEGVQAVGFFPVESMVLPKLAKLESESIHVEGDTITVNLEKRLEKLGLRAKLNLSAARCEAGAVVLEARAPDVE